MNRVLASVAVICLASPVAADPAITLEEARAEARSHAPERAAAAQRVAAAASRVDAAGRRFTADPVATVSYDDDGRRSWAVGLEWSLPISGAAGARRAAALSDVTAVEREGDADLAALDAQVAIAFAEVADAQRRRPRAERLVTLHELAVDVATRQLAAGGGSQLDVDAAALDLRGARVDLARARGDLASARIRLARLLGRSDADALVVVDELQMPPIAPIELDARVAGDARTLAAQAQIEAARRSVVAERRAARPDVLVGVEVGRVGNDVPPGAFATDPALTAAWTDWEVSLHLSVPLPLFDRNRGARAEAHARSLNAQADLGIVRADVGAEVADAHAQLLAAADAVEAARDVPEILDREIVLLDKALRAGAIDVADWSQRARRLEEAGRIYDEAVLALRRAQAAWSRSDRR